VDLWAEETSFQLSLPVGLDASELIVPAENPITASKVELGRTLFFDPRLSYDGTVSCATCHSPQLAFTDNRPVSIGIYSQLGTRNAPTIINRVFSSDQFWDGRDDSLEDQAIGPLVNPKEMGMPSFESVTSKVQGITGYREWFKEVFKRDVNIKDIGKAIASFERTLVSGNSPFDQFKAGDTNAISESARRGFDLFEGKARCNQCHSGSLFTDEKYHNLGVDWDTDTVDLGRYKVTGRADEIGAFKTPTLREIALTGPYMHDGSQATLEDTIEFYDNGGIANPFLDIEMRRPARTLEETLAFFEDSRNRTEEPQTGTDLAKLELSEQERADLVSFLETLSGEGWQHARPPTSFPEQ
jgi:cytochrome c peroxidase